MLDLSSAYLKSLLPNGQYLYIHPQQYRSSIQSAIQELSEAQILQRIWIKDHTIWKADPSEIANRLGWIDAPKEMIPHLPELEAFVTEVKKLGIKKALVLGMGGSSLAPELFGRVFRQSDDALPVEVLDSTDPEEVLDFQQRFAPSESLYIVSTKSGSTEETISFFKHFYNRTILVLGKGQAGIHFIAITDPGSPLIEIAHRYHFLRVFENNPDIGGRYSALSYFGLVPAALTGADLSLLLRRADEIAQLCKSETAPNNNPAALLGVALGELALRGRDKLTFVLPAKLACFGDWVEQLIAESTGKEGKGILPVVGEALSDASQYDVDRIFVSIESKDHEGQLSAHAHQELQALEAAGHPIIRIGLNDMYDLAGQFYLWQLATAIAGWRLQINPFDQPNVEAAKKLARRIVQEYKNSGELPQGSPLYSNAQIGVYGDYSGDTLAQALERFLSAVRQGDYIAILAYLQPKETTQEELNALRAALRMRTHKAVTLGYGPRYLHSTGQLHKGDRGNGLFLLLTAESRGDLPIPDEAGEIESSIAFGVLKMAQALGDQQALQDAARRVIRIHIQTEVDQGIQLIIKALQSRS